MTTHIEVSVSFAGRMSHTEDQLGNHAEKIDPWTQIVGDLHFPGVFTVDPVRPPSSDHPLGVLQSLTGVMANASSIRRIEWQTTCTILVSWSDSRYGSYVDQTWRAGFARINGICGLTGKPVRRGDPVFRPLQRNNAAPKNAFDMILASTVPNGTEITFD
jgi:hypothetical protein